MKTKKSWMRSNEARAILGGSSCDLMHMREAGKLRFEKQGNAFLYASEDVAREAASRKGGRAEDGRCDL